MNIVITGASAGIGEALAVEFASGNRLLLIGRDAERLSGVAERVRAAGGTPEIAIADVRDAAAMADLLGAFDDRTPVDLLVANAGVSAGLGPGRTPEAPGVSRRLLEINYAGMLHTVEPLLGRMQARRRGRIALVSSLAGMRALPDMPSYSATTAAVAAYGAALRGWLRPFGITVTVIHPGFVTSAMSARHKGAKPFEITAERAARRMRRGIMAGRGRVAFPWPLVLGIRLGQLLPPVLGDLTMRPFSATVDPDDGR